MDRQTVIVLDFGGQYKELIARRVRECSVYSLIMPGDTPIEKIREIAPIGMITTGGPMSVYDADSPKCDPELFRLGIPVLGICYGMQLMSYTLGGRAESGEIGEYGQMDAVFDTSAVLFKGLPSAQKVLMSHRDHVSELPAGFRNTSHTADCPCSSFEAPELGLFGVQFHPEVTHTPDGTKIIRNFLYDVCGAVGDYTINDYIDRQIAAVQKRVGGGKVLLGLSGGVDSSVCAALLSRALPGRLICIFVDHGMMRKNEGDEIEAAFKDRELTFVRVDASEQFLTKLSGVTEPEKKRKIIGAEFINVFASQAEKFGKDVRWLAQGTIYPDIIESGNSKAATIKSHHNVGGLPKDIKFDGIVEPLRDLFKDEVRAVGRSLGLPENIVERQPFPGPGLAIRVIGEITRPRLDLLREADAIWREEIKANNVPADQYFAVLTDLHSVGVQGDARTYDYTLALRAVRTSDFMTCEYAPVPHDVLAKVSRRITNEVRGINRVVYDITDKPPATIEWE